MRSVLRSKVTYFPSSSNQSLTDIQVDGVQFNFKFRVIDGNHRLYCVRTINKERSQGNSATPLITEVRASPSLFSNEKSDGFFINLYILCIKLTNSRFIVVFCAKTSRCWSKIFSVNRATPKPRIRRSQ
jgi:hypothetical protein